MTLGRFCESYLQRVAAGSPLFFYRLSARKSCELGLSAGRRPSPSSLLYRVALIMQLVFYALSVAALARLLKEGPVARAAEAAATFVLLNTAAVVAFANFVRGRKAVWIR